MVLDSCCRGRTSFRKRGAEPKGRGEEMLMAMPTELLDSLLSGLRTQSEISELLEELYFYGLS